MVAVVVSASADFFVLSCFFFRWVVGSPANRFVAGLIDLLANRCVAGSICPLASGCVAGPIDPLTNRCVAGSVWPLASRCVAGSIDPLTNRCVTGSVWPLASRCVAGPICPLAKRPVIVSNRRIGWANGSVGGILRRPTVSRMGYETEEGIKKCLPSLANIWLKFRFVGWSCRVYRASIDAVVA